MTDIAEDLRYTRKVEVPPGYIRFTSHIGNHEVIRTVPIENEIYFRTVSFDKRLSNAYDEKLANTKSEIYPLVSFNFSVYNNLNDDNVYCTSDGKEVKIGKTNYKAIFKFNFKRENMSSRDILVSMTDCATPETSSSSPSYILHQFISFSLLRSVQKASGIFENKATKYVPDFTLSTKEGFFNFDITTFQGAVEKVKKGVRIIALDKYTLLDLIVNQHANNEETIFPHLRKLSYANDQSNSGLIDSIISSQNILKIKTAYDREVLHHILTTPKEHIEEMSKYLNAAMTSISSKRSDSSVSPYIYKHPFARDIGFNFTKLFGFLGNIYNRPVRKSSVPSEEEPLEFAVVQDKLILTSETDQIPDKFYKRDVQQILMTDEGFNVLNSYLIGKKELQLATDYKYYNEILSAFPPRSIEYFRIKSTASLKRTLNDKKELVEKPNKTIRGLNRINPVHSVEPKTVQNSVPSVLNTIYSSIEDETYFFDPIHRKVIEISLKDQETTELKDSIVYTLSRSKIYQLLILYSKAAQAILYGKSDGASIIVKHPVLDLEIHMYCSGSVTETDKGVVYCTIVSQSRAVKSYLWRPSDLKSYSVASMRLITSVLGASIHVPLKSLSHMITIYSLIIFENSWGLSKILKPYRYFVMGQIFESKLMEGTYKKVIKAIDDNIEMSRRKMSLAYMHLISLNAKNNTKTPLLDLDQSHAGYEMFLVNMCPSSTYGKRRHRCNVLKELAKEIEMSDKFKDSILHQNKVYLKFVREFLEAKDPKAKLSLCFGVLEGIYESGKEMKGRFTYSPISILLIYPEIKETCNKTKIDPVCQSISQLCTMKSSFDSIDFKNESALSVITNLVTKLDTPTTPLTALSLLRRMPLDLTYRMFDKDQVGGDREISILTGEFRVLQSITESFSKDLGVKTQVDMLSNSNKVEMMCNYQNECTKNRGVRETIDQTRWGPNFNTSLFGYMFAMISRFTTESFVPMITCFLSEMKVFSMNPYPELVSYQKVGYTLPGIIGQFHMGQGIFHYTSSLYHSFVSMNICKQRQNFCSGTKTILYSKPMVTSDDVCIFNYVPLSQTLKTSELDRSLAYSKLNVMISNYPKVVNIYGVLTSDYKNIISKDSVEFNSIFLHSKSVGSNSLKFLYSLVDPYTTGNKLRDARNIFDTYSDAINSSMSPREAKIVMLSKLVLVMLRWAESSTSILKVLDEAEKDSLDPYFPLRCQTRTIAESPIYEVRSPTILPHKTYESATRNLNKLIAIEPRFEIQSIYHLKMDTLKLAKQRKLGSNKGIVMSRRMREKARISLGASNPHNALEISLPAYLMSVMVNKGEYGLVSPKMSSILSPSTSIIDHREGFQVMYMKITKGMKLSLSELIISSYPRVSSISSESTDREVYLHILRKYKILNFDDNSKYVDLNFQERIKLFDSFISETRISGMTRNLTYSKEGSHTSLIFPFPGSIISSRPSLLISKVVESLESNCPSEVPTYTLMNYGSEIKSVQVLVGNNLPTVPIEEEYTVSDESIIDSIISVTTSDRLFSECTYDDVIYINFDIIVNNKQSSIIPEEEADDDTEITFANQTINVEDIPIELIEKLQQAVVKSGLDLSQSSVQGPEDNLDFKKSVLNDIFGTTSHKIRRKRMSIIVPKYAEMINQGWYSNHCIRNGIMLDMVKKGFIQNISEIKPESLLYSISTKDRRAAHIRNVIHNGQKAQYCLGACFSIPMIVDQACRSYTAHESYVPDSDRMIRILRFLQDPLDADIHILSGLPSGFEFSKEAEGETIEMWDAEDLLKTISKAERIEDLYDRPSMPIVEPTVDEPDYRWADYED